MVPASFSSISSLRTSRMPCGSRPFVGSSSTSSSGLRRSAPASPSRCFMPSEYAFTGRSSTFSIPTRSSASAIRAPRGRACSPPGPAASRSMRLRRPERLGQNAGDSMIAPTRSQRGPGMPGHRDAPISSMRPDGGEDEPEQHAHGRRLAGAVGSEEAVPVALAHVEIQVVNDGDLAVPLGQPFGSDHV